MSYASDHDDMEQAKHGSDSGDAFEEFVYQTVGMAFGELSNNEKALVAWQWRKHCKPIPKGKTE